jgi:hypothetical protein
MAAWSAHFVHFDLILFLVDVGDVNPYETLVITDSPDNLQELLGADVLRSAAGTHSKRCCRKPTDLLGLPKG